MGYQLEDILHTVCSRRGYKCRQGWSNLRQSSSIYGTIPVGVRDKNIGHGSLERFGFRRKREAKSPLMVRPNGVSPHLEKTPKQFCGLRIYPIKISLLPFTVRKKQSLWLLIFLIEKCVHIGNTFPRGRQKIRPYQAGIQTLDWRYRP